jgi:hypothetical protein
LFAAHSLFLPSVAPEMWEQGKKANPRASLEFPCSWQKW